MKATGYPVPSTPKRGGAATGATPSTARRRPGPFTPLSASRARMIGEALIAMNAKKAGGPEANAGRRALDFSDRPPARHDENLPAVDAGVALRALEAEEALLQKQVAELESGTGRAPSVAVPSLECAIDKEIADLLNDSA
ncbi:unnamed protein product (mitochondrion) [Plasmodiophora brassicae]|uniref:Uncharacterized protein n=1 Tax=Plasmodiophora brassicae TaxID=37360 RepID=A0A3P3YHV6_PLABS|nr:unnamed protein product [Plasmodiophora brassicae]